MSFLRGNPAKSAAKHEKRAREHQTRGNEQKAADEWTAAGRDYLKIPNYARAYEAYIQAAQFYLAVNDVNRETEALFAAIDAAIAANDFEAAAGALTQVTRIGARKKDNQLLLRAYAVQSIIHIAGNDLSKAKESHHEALKIEKRIGRKKATLPVYQVASAFVDRFIEGNTVPDDQTLPNRFDESAKVKQVIENLLALYDKTMKTKLELVLGKEEVKIKERVTGHVAFSFSIPIQVVETTLALPSNIACLQDPKMPEKTQRKFKLSFTIEPRLPGEFDVGPFTTLLQAEHQQFIMKSNAVPLKIIAAKPRLNVTAEPTSTPLSQEEFELVLRVENDSHGDASDVIIVITLPPHLLLKTGTLQKRIVTLHPQQHVQFPLFLIGTKAGNLEGIVKCTYKGPSGRSQKIEEKFSVKILPRLPKQKD
jgi:tetratricopeptide (TPR) repeat protein